MVRDKSWEGAGYETVIVAVILLMFSLTCSFVTEVTSTRSAEDYTLSMQLVTTEAPLILALKVLLAA